MAAEPVSNVSRKVTWLESVQTLQLTKEEAEVVQEVATEPALSATKKDTWQENALIKRVKDLVEAEVEEDLAEVVEPLEVHATSATKRATLPESVQMIKEATSDNS